MPRTPENPQTKHEKLRLWIIGQIMDGTLKIGDRLTSENELCTMFGISRHTVRHALDLLDSEGIVDRRRGSGTYILRNPARQHKSSKLIGVAMSYLDSYIFPNILKGIDDVLTRLDYHILPGITYNRVQNERHFLQSCLEHSVDGVIIEASKSAYENPNLDLYRELESRSIPCIFINCYYGGYDCNYVITDDFAGGFMAASHLLKAGHRRIGGIFKKDDMQGQRRYAGFSSALSARGIGGFDDHTVFYKTEDLDMFIDEKFDKEVLRVLSGCTGIVCYNDNIAANLIAMLDRNAIKVPEDVSIVSFDNSNLSVLCSVKLTTIAHPGEKLGKVAAQGIYNLIAGSQKKFVYTFSPELVERNSVKSLK
jgi:Transcriptional regulators